MKRRTKIVSTLGPSTDDTRVPDQLIAAGVDVVRLNFSHGSADDHRRRAQLVRELSQKHRRHVAILGDLQGPKTRIARFANGPIQLAAGDTFCLDGGLDRNAGDQHRVGIDYPQLVNDLSNSDIPNPQVEPPKTQKALFV